MVQGVMDAMIDMEVRPYNVFSLAENKLETLKQSH